MYYVEYLYYFQFPEKQNINICYRYLNIVNLWLLIINGKLYGKCTHWLNQNQCEDFLSYVSGQKLDMFFGEDIFEDQSANSTFCG